MAPTIDLEFPIKKTVNQLKEEGRLKEDSKVFVFWTLSVYLENNYLGTLNFFPHDPKIFNKIFLKFLEKFGHFSERRWRVEYRLLLAAYQCYKRNPQELERILKVAKTKKDLKLHLGIS